MNSGKTLAELIPSLTHKPRLMIVDDQPLIIRSLNEIFKAEFEIVMATSGRQALELCADNKPDIMLLDIMMPDMNGYDVCKTLKADPVDNDFPIIFVTAQNEVVDEVRAFDAGAVDFITKPINPVVVFARVRTHVTVKLQRDILHSIAMLDGLTGVANRRRFDEQLQVHWRQGQRDKKPLSLILIDIDFFKQYNDHYGHLAGDKALQEVAHALRSVLLRPHDSVSRYGGEEFVCLLPGTDNAGAMLLAERLLAAVAALTIRHEKSLAGDVLSISAGVATVTPSAKHNAGQLIAAADEQLYAAKHAGRQCVRNIDIAS